MECLKCKTSNPETNRFCSQCGTPLDPRICTLNDYICQQVESTLKTQAKERNLIEIEIAEAISTKFVKWAKIFAYIVGIPLGLLSLMLIIFGIKSIYDITFASSMVEKASQIYKDAEKLKPRVDKVTEQLEPLELSVKRLESRIVFYETPIEKELSSQLESFINFFKKLGYKPIPGTRVRVDPKLKDNTYYDTKENIIIIGEKIKNDTDLLLREYAMHVLATSLAKAGVDRDHFDNQNKAIESGLEDYFTCSHTNNPKFGTITSKIFKELYGVQFYKESQLRDLENNLKFGDIAIVNPFQNGGIWGAAFWEIRKLSGKEYSDNLLFKTWNEYINDLNSPDYSPANSPINFVKKLLEVDQQLSKGKYINQIKAIFSRRGLNIQS
jgi:hypothetical protein